MNKHKKEKGFFEKKEKSGKSLDLRTESFIKDNKFSVKEDLGRYCVIGDISKFVYKAHLEEKEAQDYACELNKNKELTLLE